jgi:hypothetical protein
MSTKPYERLGFEVVAVGDGVATLKRLGGETVFPDVPFDQIELQRL